MSESRIEASGTHTPTGVPVDVRVCARTYIHIRLGAVHKEQDKAKIKQVQARIEGWIRNHDAREEDERRGKTEGRRVGRAAHPIPASAGIFSGTASYSLVLRRILWYCVGSPTLHCLGLVPRGRMRLPMQILLSEVTYPAHLDQRAAVYVPFASTSESRAKHDRGTKQKQEGLRQEAGGAALEREQGFCGKNSSSVEKKSPHALSFHAASAQNERSQDSGESSWPPAHTHIRSPALRIHRSTCACTAECPPARSSPQIDII
ncbi:hypothetical protein B0H19DRAFT_1075712 [Mycena capillaripes]|nr:hypothetical protein B0H19DRAFT_1075712 [Mycena capillaripes]